MGIAPVVVVVELVVGCWVLIAVSMVNFAPAVVEELVAVAATSSVVGIASAVVEDLA